MATSPELKAKWQAAKAKGKEAAAKFLKNHPDFAASHPEIQKNWGGVKVTPPPVSGQPRINTRGAKPIAKRPLKKLDKGVPKYIKGEEEVGRGEAEKNIEYQNPDIMTDFGGSNVRFDEETGRPIYTETLSEPNKEIIEAGQGLSKKGIGAAEKALSTYRPYAGPGNLNTFMKDVPKAGALQGLGGKDRAIPEFRGSGRAIPEAKSSAGSVPRFQDIYTEKMEDFKTGAGAGDVANNLISGFQKFKGSGSPEERARIEEAVFGRLTKNLERDRAKDIEAKRAELTARGIPFDSKMAAAELGQINERYDAQKADAMGQAVEMGGNEMSRSFGMDVTAHQTDVGDIGSMYGIAKDTHQVGTSDIGQKFGQSAAASELGTNQQKTQFDEDMAYTAQQADLQDQDFSQNLAYVQENADLSEKDFARRMAKAQFGREGTQTAFDMAMNRYQAGTGAQQQAFGQGLTAHQQNVSDMGTLSSLGTGAIMPNLPGYKGASVDYSNPSELALALKQFRAQQAANKAKSGGGGGGGGAFVPSGLPA